MRAHFRGIIDRIIGNRKSNCLSNKEWGEFSDMAALHLNSQVQQYDGFTPGQRLFGRTPKLPIGAAGSPNFRFHEASCRSNHEIVEFDKYDFQIRKAPSAAGFNGK